MGRQIKEPLSRPRHDGSKWAGAVTLGPRWVPGPDALTDRAPVECRFCSGAGLGPSAAGLTGSQVTLPLPPAEPTPGAPSGHGPWCSGEHPDWLEMVLSAADLGVRELLILE